MKKSELILNSDGSIYHLNLLPHEIATHVITAGDPERIRLIAKSLQKIEYEKSKREFLTITGYYKDLRITLISTGIGTDNIDIVFNELDALWNIDFEKRAIKEELLSAKILRLGTCGSLQKEIPPGAFIFSSFALGADGLMEYYPITQFTDKEALEHRYKLFRKNNSDLPNYIYFAKATETILPHLPENIVKGITLTAKGFYAPQGRNLGRMNLPMPNLVESMSTFSYESNQLTNMEMETAGILGLGASLGHQAASISVALANRITGEFSSHPSDHVKALIDEGLEIMYKWSQ
ncbi:MAG: nucleoside phosphorylase [Bacteroidia bacterium]|nr:nucleoside phosphorylase [Bacteroidia bacterium]